LVPRPTDPTNSTNINGPFPAPLNLPALPTRYQSGLGTVFNYPQDAAIPVVFGGTDPVTGTTFPSLTIKSMNRTFVDLTGGREWYLNAPASGCCPLWRAGFDAG